MLSWRWCSSASCFKVSPPCKSRASAKAEQNSEPCPKNMQPKQINTSVAQYQFLFCRISDFLSVCGEPRFEHLVVCVFLRTERALAQLVCVLSTAKNKTNSKLIYIQPVHVPLATQLHPLHQIGR